MITIDRRQGSGDLLRHFPAGRGSLGDLEFGDFSFIGKGPQGVPVFIGVERKTLADLISSASSGRLQGHQLPGMLSSYNYCYLVLEGVWTVKDGDLQHWRRGKWSRVGGMSARGLHSLLNTLSTIAGFQVVRTDNPQNTVSWLLDLADWWGKPYDRHRGHLGFQVEPRPSTLLSKPNLVRRVAKELPGVGWERSKAVADHFGSVWHMVTSNQDEWRTIPGIGKTMSASIVDALHRTCR
jgi:ERCC4-type nuclease